MDQFQNVGQQMNEDEILKYVQLNHPDTMEKMKDQEKMKTKPLSNKEYIKLKGNIDSLLDSEGGINIEPEIGFVIKTFDSHKEKIFINVTQHEIIDMPEEKLLVDYENQPGLRIPMSVGRVKEDFDKKGGLCKVIDVVLNPEIVQKVQDDKGLLAVVMNLFEYYFQEKHKILLKGKMKLPKLNYKGKSVEIQRVKGKKQPKIDLLDQEMTEQDEKQNDIMNQQKDQVINQPQVNKPDFDIIVQYDDDTEEPLDEYYNQQQLKCIKLLIQLPLLITGKFIRLEVSQDEFYLKNAKIYELILRLPFKVKTEQIKAVFENETRILTPKQQQDQPQQEQNVERIRRQKQAVDLKNNLLDDLV